MTSAAVVIGTSSLALPARVAAAVANPAPAAKISFTFDDGKTSAYTQAAPILRQYGYTGTAYVTTGCVGMTTVPNTCHADQDDPYMTWAQVKALRDTYGWEIGSHTVSHPYLASTNPDDGQPNLLTPAQIDAELKNSRDALAAQGIQAISFATPYGDYTMPVLAQIAKYYANHRGFADVGYNIWPNNEYLIRDQQVQVGVTVNQVKAYIDAAIANKQWLVLTFHDIKLNASSNPDDYEYGSLNLAAIAAYAKSKGLANSNVKDATTNSDVNLLANSSFNNGIADGWTTDAAANIVRDSANNGSYPDATNSVKITGTNRAIHLFSPKVAVDFNTTYMLKNFLNVAKITSGEVGFYIDEYNANGNWISGQYRKAERSVWVESLNFDYKPSSPNVSRASLQVFTTANSGVTAYLDNVQWFPLSAATATNLVANGTFDAGISGDWTTNSPTSITADNTGNGSPANPVNSVKAVATTTNRHLFSPSVAVAATRAYALSTFVKVNALSSGEIGFYIDEYNAAGNWISGQYKGGVRAAGSGNFNFAYTPSSASVARAQLQVIVVGNSGITAYIDDVKWY